MSNISRRRLLKHSAIATLLGSSSAFRRVFADALSKSAQKFSMLSEKLGGTVVSRGQSDYEELRQNMVWQRMKPYRHPRAIVQVTSVADIQAALSFAREEDLKVSVRCGGHNFSGVVLENDSLLLDLSRLGSISVNAEEQIARVGPAITGAGLIWHLDPHKLVFPAPHCGNVPISGFLLGGGLGWNGDAWGGISSNSVKAVELVTPDGKHITASADRNPDWYWLARGAGPAFCGVITKFHLQLYPLPRAITASFYTWDAGDVEEVASWLYELSHDLPLNVELISLITTLTGAGEEGSAGSRLVFMLSATAFADTKDEAHSVLGRLAAGKPVSKCIEKSEFQPAPLQTLFDWDMDSFPWARWSADNIWTDTAPAPVLARIRDQFAEVPSPRTTAIYMFRRTREKLPDAALSRAGSAYVAWYANWDEANEDKANNAWVDKMRHGLEEYSVGNYINETDYVNFPERGINSYSPESLVRIRKLRNQFDPQGRFHDYL